MTRLDNIDCGKCFGKGYFLEVIPGTDNDYPSPDYSEKYCDCSWGALRKREDSNSQST